MQCLAVFSIYKQEFINDASLIPKECLISISGPVPNIRSAPSHTHTHTHTHTLNLSKVNNTKSMTSKEDVGVVEGAAAANSAGM